MRTQLSLVLVSSIVSLGCGNKAAPKPEKEAPPPAVTSAAPTASAASAIAPAVKTIPRLLAEKIKPKEGKPGRLYPIEGAIMVDDGQRVGRLVGDDVEWIGSIPKDSPGLGQNELTDVLGRWPDLVAAVYRSGNPRASQPTYHPLSGKAGSHRVGPGGNGMIYGVARIGDSIILAGHDYIDGHLMLTVQGRPVARIRQKEVPAGCKLPQERRLWKMDDAAVPATAIGSTRAGTLVTLGSFCGDGPTAAEVWDKDGKSRIIKLDQWWKKLPYGTKVLTGSGDELFVYSGPFLPMLRYHDGEFEALPLLDRPVRAVLVSPSGKLHASDGSFIHRYEGGKWTPVAALPDVGDQSSLALDENGTFWGYGAAKLREGEGVPLPAPCEKPIVYMYESAYVNNAQVNFTYPTTQKALSSFPEVASIALLEYGQSYDKHLAVEVESRAQGEAVIAHVLTTMPDERPKLFCYTPESPRRIPITVKAKP